MEWLILLLVLAICSQSVRSIIGFVWDISMGILLAVYIIFISGPLHVIGLKKEI
jgi:hypothetical protein